jgi:hypothetical protein
MLLYKDSTLVTGADLEAMPAPRALGRSHQPVPHAALVRGIYAVSAARGYAVTRQQLAVNRSGHRLFGVLDLAPAVRVIEPAADRWGFAIGFRNSTDESLGIRLVAGLRVQVCDNLALSGDLIALKRRNTTGLDLGEALAGGFDRYLAHAQSLDDQVEAWQTATISTLHAKARLFDLFAHKVLPLRLLPMATRYYFNPDESMTDCQPRTVWALHNAVTRAIKTLPPVRAFAANVSVGRAFGLGHQTAVH